MANEKEKESPIRIIKTAIGLANFGNVDIGGDLFKLLDSIETDLNDINSDADDDEFIDWSATTRELMEELNNTIIDELRQQEGEIDETEDNENNNEREEVDAREEEIEEDNDDEDEEERDIESDATFEDEDDEEEEGRNYEDDEEDDIPPGELPQNIDSP
jgi:hypothetical protein